MIESMIGLVEIVKNIKDEKAKREIIDDYYRQYMVLFNDALEKAKAQAHSQVPEQVDKTTDHD